VYPALHVHAVFAPDAAGDAELEGHEMHFEDAAAPTYSE